MSLGRALLNGAAQTIYLHMQSDEQWRSKSAACSETFVSEGACASCYYAISIASTVCMDTGQPQFETSAKLLVQCFPVIRTSKVVIRSLANRSLHHMWLSNSVHQKLGNGSFRAMSSLRRASSGYLSLKESNAAQHFRNASRPTQDQIWLVRHRSEGLPRSAHRSCRQ